MLMNVFIFSMKRAPSPTPPTSTMATVTTSTAMPTTMTVLEAEVTEMVMESLSPSSRVEQEAQVEQSTKVIDFLLNC